MKPPNQFVQRFRWRPGRLAAALLRKIFRQPLFAKYEVAPQLNVPAAERRILRKMRSPKVPPAVNH